ncbi:MAG: TIGR03086 family protein [Chloroflexi bacterium]|nr:TIGR03086 family protein [Chloroflexota bacterium]
MTNGELLVRAMAATQRYVDGVPAGRWQAATPCPKWDVRMVVNHLISEASWAGELFRGKTIAEVGDRFDGDLTEGDPATAYRRATEVARAAVEAPGAMETICHLSFGDFPGAGYAGQLFEDFLVHGWDIARGSGQDDRLEPELVAACLPMARKITEQARVAGWFGSKVDVPRDANVQAKLLALLGRRG